LAPAAPPLPPAAERQRVIEAVAGALLDSARGAPLVLALDDAQEASPLLVAALARVARDLAAARARSTAALEDEAEETAGLDVPRDADFVCLLTLAGEELYGRPAEGALQRLRSTPGVRVLAHEALGPEDLAELLASALGRDLGEVRDLTSALAAASGGPSQALGMLDALAAAGDLPAPDGAWSLEAGALDLPRAADALRRRLEDLPELARDLLGSLALARRALPVRLLASALGRDPLEVLSAARALERRGLLLSPLGSPPEERLALRGPSAVEQVLATIEDAEMQRLSRAVAEGVARLDRPQPWAECAAQRFLACGQPDRAVPFAALAAERALAESQPELAVDLLEPALRALGDDVPSSQGLPPGVRDAVGTHPAVRAQLLLAQALRTLGRAGPARAAAQRALSRARVARLPRGMIDALLEVCEASLALDDAAQAKAAADEAHALARDEGWARGRARALLWRGRAERAAGDRDEALGSLKEARELLALSGDASLHAELLREEAALRAERGEQGLALELADLALDREEDAERPAQAARTQLLRARLFAAAGQLDRARDTAERALAVLARSVDPVGLCEAFSLLAEIQLRRGEAQQARRRAEAALALCERLEDRRGASLQRLALGRILLVSGPLDAAERTLRDAAGALREAGHRAGTVAASLGIAELSLLRGDLPRAREIADRGLAEAEAAGASESLLAARRVVARIALLQGDLVGAEETAQQAAEGASRRRLGALEAASRALLGRTRLCRGQLVEADRELRDALDLARDHSAGPLEARIRLSLARLHQLRGEPASALSEAGKARDAAQRVEDVELEVESLLGLGRLHLFLGQSDRARTLLDMALERSQELGLGLLLPTAQALRAEAELRTTPPDAGRCEALLAAADEAARAAGRRTLQAELDCIRARLALSRGEPAMARERAEAALETYEVSGHLLGRLRAALLLAAARSALGHQEAALAAAEEAIATAESLRDGEARAEGLLARARARRALGQVLPAAHDLRDAASQLRGVWASLPEDLRGDYQSKPLVREVTEEASAVADEAERLLAQTPASSPSRGQGPAEVAPAVPPPPSPRGEQRTAVDPEAGLDSLRDPLTQLYNHTFFTAQLETELKRAQRHSRPLALLKVNIDRFKLVRELHGQRVGKEVIREVAGLLLRHVRDVDLVARYFGDEFEVLLPDTDARGARLTAERIREAAEAHRFVHDEEKIELTLTIGIAVYPRDAQDRDALICRADEALYNARNRGSNAVFAFGGDAEATPPEETSPELRELDQLMLTREGRTILSMVQRLVNQELNMERVIELVCGMIVEATRGERGFVMLKGPGGDFVFRHGRNMDDKVISAPELQISSSIAREVAETGEPVIVSEALEDERFRGFKSVMDLNLRSILCAPIKVGEDVLGVIYVDHNQVARRFTQEDLNFLVAIANKVAVPIKNSKKLRDTEDRLAAAEARLKSQAADLQTKYSYDSIVGRSEPMQRVFKLLDRIVETNHSVVIHGESGTGKELIARAIHYNGPRKQKPFVAENCAALSDTLLEAELFGHVKGAFTGADRDSKGLFELANGGTLFLDEIGDMSERMQKKLLRVLQEGEVRPVGGKRVFHVDVRIVSASNKDLKQLVAERKFREDLYYRLNVITVSLPPLRERRDDVVLLVEHFLEQHAKAGAPREIDRETLGYLMNYDWPGNVRELENEVNRLIAMSDDLITADLLSPKIREGGKASLQTADGLSRYYDRPLKEVEYEFMRDVILHTLEKTNWHRTKAAKILKVPTSTLFNKMKKYGIG
ncbi:MAG: diguanylate cyclase, partial [Planctomycetota bacterium]